MLVDLYLKMHLNDWQIKPYTIYKYFTNLLYHDGGS